MRTAEYGRIQRNTSGKLGSNPYRVNRGPADFPREPHRLAFYGSNTDAATALPTLEPGPLLSFPKEVMGPSGKYGVLLSDIGPVRSLGASAGQKTVLRAECSAVDCHSSDYLAIRVRYDEEFVEGLEDVYEYEVYFDDNCDATLDTCQERIPRLVSEVNADQDRLILSMVSGTGAEAGKYFLQITTDVPRLIGVSLEGFGPVQTVTPYVARDLYAQQLGSWNRPGLGEGQPDNAIKGFELPITFHVEKDADEAGSSNVYAQRKSYTTQMDTFVVAFDVTNARALAAYTELSTILLGTKTPATLYNRKLGAV